MTDIAFPLSPENVAQCMAERDAEIERLRAALLDALTLCGVWEDDHPILQRARAALGTLPRKQKAPIVSYICPDCGESIKLGFGHRPGCDKTIGRS